MVVFVVFDDDIWLMEVGLVVLVVGFDGGVVLVMGLLWYYVVGDGWSGWLVEFVNLVVVLMYLLVLVFLELFLIYGMCYVMWMDEVWWLDVFYVIWWVLMDDFVLVLEFW